MTIPAEERSVSCGGGGEKVEKKQRTEFEAIAEKCSEEAEQALLIPLIRHNDPNRLDASSLDELLLELTARETHLPRSLRRLNGDGARGSVLRGGRVGVLDGGRGENAAIDGFGDGREGDAEFDKAVGGREGQSRLEGGGKRTSSGASGDKEEAEENQVGMDEKCRKGR
jgi:hypothetical protein